MADLKQEIIELKNEAIRQSKLHATTVQIMKSENDSEILGKEAAFSMTLKYMKAQYDVQNREKDEALSELRYIIKISLLVYQMMNHFFRSCSLP